MVNYANGKIYKIVGETGATYYGSTVRSLKLRMYQHRYYKDTSAYPEIISQMDCEIILIENYPCESRKELVLREGTYIRENPCVNRNIAGRSKKEWIKSNPEKIKANHKKYHKENREEIKAKHKKYYQDNREEKNAMERRRRRWIYSFGSPRNTNNLQRCDSSLFE